MDQWSAVHRVFAVETFFKNNDSVITTQRIFRLHFNIGRHGRVPDCNTIKNWVEMFRTTAFATNKNPGGSVWTPENIERVRAAIGHSPKRSAHRHSVTFSTFRADRFDRYCIRLTLSPLQNTDCATTVKPWFCFKKSFVSNLLP
jgi:hypothetical protein